MSGIFGCWHLDGRTVDVATFRSCIERINPAGVIPSAWHDGAVGLAYKCNGNSVLATPPSVTIGASHIACVFDGRLDNRDELLLTLGEASPDPDSPDCDVIRAAYEAFGDTFIDRIKGDFACAVFDRAANRLLVARDRLGVRPLCFTRVNDTLLFASDAKALLAWPGVSAAPDDAMMADFVLQFVSLDSQQRTFFRNIRSVPPAHVLVASAHGSSLRRYFDFDTRRDVRLGSFRDYADAFHQLVAASVRNRLRHRAAVAVSVSGGLDSAYIFSIATRLIREGAAPCPSVLGFNYAGAPNTPSDEEEYVRAIEQSCDAIVERIPQRAGFMEFAADEVWHSESPLVEALSCQRQAMLRRAREAGAGRLLTGHWGDQMLFDTDYLVDLCRSRQWTAAKHHSNAWGLRRGRLALRVVRDLTSRHLPVSFVRAARRVRRRKEAPWSALWYTRRFRTLVRERFEDGRLPRTGGTSHAWAIYQQSRREYHVQCMEWNNRVAAMHGLDIAFPYLDCDLVQFLMSIPGEIQSHDGVPRGLMREAMRGRVADTVVNRCTKGEFTELANRSVAIDFSRIREILGPSSLAVRFGFVDGPALWPLLDEWKKAVESAPDATLANRLLELCGMELLLRQFAEPRHSIGISEAHLSGS
ncbi:MAG: asparagine synthetase B family protein [Vicinamibacterales bacterium]